MAGKSAKKIQIVVALELLIWHSLVLPQHQTKEYKQNLTNVNYVYGDFSITYAQTHLKIFFSDLNQQKKITEKI